MHLEISQPLDGRHWPFFAAMQIDGFIDKTEFKKQIDEWIRVFRNTKPAPGTSGPLIPGDPEREAEAIRSKKGIPLLKRWWMICWRDRKDRDTL